MAVILELSKYIVPDLHETVSVSAGFRIGLICHVFFSTVIIDL